MAEAPEPSQPSVQRSDTTGTTSSSDHSNGERQSSSPTDTVFSNAPVSPVGSSSNHARPGTSGGTGRKRKVPDSITPNACTNCKKARAKCDGAKPACKRCTHRRMNDSCHYEIHAKTAKEQMIREIQRLQRKNEDLEEEKGTLDEKNSWIEQIMRSLKDDGHGSEIIGRLKRGESHQAIAEWLGRPFIGEGNMQLAPTTEQQIRREIEQYHKDLVENHDPRYWTNVTNDAQLIDHLIDLYLTWIHPVHMLFDEKHFMSSFRECLDVYCSHALISVICAMSCHLLHNIDTEDEETKEAVDSLRERFMEEARGRLKHADHGKMTTVQSYAIMFVSEFGSGHGLMASSHLRLATEILIDKQHTEQSEEAERVAAWGILTLHTAWSGFIYQKPQAPISTQAYPFPGSIFDREGNGYWRLYKQPGDSDISQRPSYAVITAAEHARLFRIVHESILVYCGSRGRVSGQRLFDIYERYSTWRNELPSEIREVGDHPLPHVSFLFVQYHTAAIQLLQPVLHLDNIDREPFNALQALIVQHAKAGLQLLIQYETLYTNTYLSPLQLLCLVQICDAVVHYDGIGDTTPQTIDFCLTSLQNAKGGYPVAGPLQKMFRNALAEYRLPVPDELERKIGSSARLGPEELLDACTRTTYRQPIPQILPNMHEDTGRDFIKCWQHRYSEERSTGERSRASSMMSGGRLHIGSLLNP